ncbi:hypothetical protein, partial [Clostridium thermobutyricum]|uniref:hypothetical protein n=1 Tax=Clostridium thermobutyricum TaxID=29372 RepID=UPI001A9A56B4
FTIYKCISEYNKRVQENVEIAINEINTAPDLKKIQLNNKYNKDIYAAIVIKGVSQVKGIIANEILNLNFTGFYAFQNVNNEFSSECNLTNKLNNALKMKMIKNFEDYINEGNIKLNIPAIEKELGVKSEKDIFVSAKVVKNKEPNLPNRNIYIDPKIAMLKGIKMPNYNGGYLEIVFLNKNNVINYLNKANQNQGSEQYKVSNDNISGFDILLAYIWMNNSYTPLYFTDTPLYSGNSGWTVIDKYNNKNSNGEEEEPDINTNSTTSSDIEEEAESSNSNNISNTSNSNEDENNSASSSSSIEESSGSSNSSSSSISSEEEENSSSSFSSCSDDDD